MFASITLNGAALGYSSHGSYFCKQHNLSGSISCKASTALDMGKKNKTNLYRVLSLESENVGFDEIRKAYRSLALRYHPDACPPSKKEESTRMFVELRLAYETLSDPELRRKYDHGLSVNGSESSFMRSKFAKGTWEDQLRELVWRSERRERYKTGVWGK